MNNDQATALLRTFESYLCELIHEIHTEPKAEEKQKLVDVEELAIVTGLSVSHLYLAARSGEIPCIKRGRRVLFSVPDVLAALKKKKNG